MTPSTIAGITAAQFDAALKEFSEAVRAKWYMPQNTPPSERLKIQRRADIAAERTNTIRDVLRLGFAEAHGWRWDKYASARHTDVFLERKRVVARVFHGFEPFDKKPLGVDLPFSWRHGVHSHASPGKGFAVLVKELV